MTPLEAFERDLMMLESIDGLDEITDALHHDVGKYIARIAKNVSPDETPLAPPLLAMLVKDLYETYRGQPASARFAALHATLPESLRASPILANALASLRTIDAHEPDVRAGDMNATRIVIRESLLVSRILGEVARAVRRTLETRGEHA